MGDLDDLAPQLTYRELAGLATPIAELKDSLVDCAYYGSCLIDADQDNEVEMETLQQLLGAEISSAEWCRQQLQSRIAEVISERI